jgi:hypothetical protein
MIAARQTPLPAAFGQDCDSGFDKDLGFDKDSGFDKDLGFDKGLVPQTEPTFPNSCHATASHLAVQPRLRIAILHLDYFEDRPLIKTAARSRHVDVIPRRVHARVLQIISRSLGARSPPIEEGAGNAG